MWDSGGGGKLRKEFIQWVNKWNRSDELFVGKNQFSKQFSATTTTAAVNFISLSSLTLCGELHSTYLSTAAVEYIKNLFFLLLSSSSKKKRE